jgi:hypothetical protein
VGSSVGRCQLVPGQREDSDAEADFDVLLVAGVGVEVVGGAAIEFVALTHLAADEEAQSYGSEAGGDPADGLDESRFVIVVFELFRVGEGKAGGERNVVLGFALFNARFGAEPHAWMIAQVAGGVGGPVDGMDASLVLSGGRVLGDVYLLESEAVEEGGDGGAGIFPCGVEDAVCEGSLLELLLGLGAGVGFEVLVGGDKESGGAGVDAGVLVVEGGKEELGGGEGDVDRGAVDADVFGLQLAEIDSGDGLSMDDEEETVAGEEVGEDGAGVSAFDDGIDGVDDGFEPVEALDALDDGGNGGVEGGGAAGDGCGDAGEGSGGGVADEEGEGCCSEDEREEDGEDGS